MSVRTMTETFPVVGGLPLRLSFTPDAIREHFEDDDEFATVSDLDDEALSDIGAIALTDDRLYEAFHRVLADAVKEEGVN